MAEIESKLLLRISSDLQKELIRQKSSCVIDEIQSQIDGLKELYKEIEDFRTIKRILNQNK